MTTQKICLFLDIDGVLNTDKWLDEQAHIRKQSGIKISSLFERGLSHLNEEPIRILNELVTCFNLPVVISSNWRSRFSLKEIFRMLSLKGFKGEIIGQTPTNLAVRMSEEVPRYKEILKWLETNPTIEDFVILDDSPLGFYDRKNPKECKNLEDNHLIRVNPENGLDQETADRVSQLIQKKIRGLSQ